MIVQRVKKKDLLDIWIWRNDAKTIFFSKNKKKISLKKHNQWFSKALHNSKIKFYIGVIFYKKKEIKVGIVRFDIKKRYALVSINLNPQMRGKKLSDIFLAAAIKRFIKFKKIKLLAEIKKNNLASISCFLKNNFIFLKSKNQYSFYQKSLG
jgi:L-amino acid N-acyltransferase YncA